MTLLATLRADRPLLIAVCVATAFCVLPMFVTPLLPLLDLPNHVALASSMDEILRGEGLSATEFEIRFRVLPYWTFYVVVASIGLVLGPLLGAKVAVALSLLLLPFGFIRLLVALGRDPRIGVLSFALVWDYSAYMGFMSYRLSVGLSLFVLAWLLETPNIKRAALGGWRVALLGVTHAQGLGLFIVSAFALTPRTGQSWRRLANTTVALAVGAVVLSPWVLGRTSTASPRPKKLGGIATWNTSTWERVGELHDYTIGNIPTSFGLFASWTTLVIVVLTPLALLFLRRRQPAAPWLAPILFLVATLLLYFAAPLWLGWPIQQWGVYVRHGTWLVLAILLLPQADLSGRRGLAMLAPGFAALLLLHVAISAQFSEFGSRARGVVQIIDAVEPQSAILGLVVQQADPVIIHDRVWNQVPAYVVAVKGGYEPNIFNFKSNVMGHKRRQTWPRPGWRTPRRFTRKAHAPHYDYLVTRGRVPNVTPGPLPNGGGRIEHVLDAEGGWSLHRVVHDDGPIRDKRAAKK